MFFLNILVVLLLLSAMIIVHEFGHWIVARKLGFQTPIFGFGLPFGKAIKLGKWFDTEFRFHWFVLGGYVAIPELGDESAEELKEEMPNLKPLQFFPVWKRALVASAGVFFNIVFAYLLCLVMVATIGPPSENREVVITDIIEGGYIARDAGLKVGDIILKVNDKDIKSVPDLIKNIAPNKFKKVNLTIKRIYFESDKKKFELIPKTVIPNAEGRIGIGVGYANNGEYEKPSRNPLLWLYQSAKLLLEWSISMLIGLWMMLVNIIGLAPKNSPKVGAGDLHGILAIVSVFAQALTVDFREVFRWSAMININLAIVNLLPIPALDGGHLLFMFVEKLRGKKIADSIQQKAIKAGFVFLIGLMFFVIFNDIKGLITGKFNLPTKEEVNKETIIKNAE